MQTLKTSKKKQRKQLINPVSCRSKSKQYNASYCKRREKHHVLYVLSSFQPRCASTASANAANSPATCSRSSISPHSIWRNSSGLKKHLLFASWQSQACSDFVPQLQKTCQRTGENWWKLRCSMQFSSSALIPRVSLKRLYRSESFKGEWITQCPNRFLRDCRCKKTKTNESQPQVF